MCTIQDLVIVVVEPDEIELEKTCSSLEKLGVGTIMCVKGYEDAMAIINQDKHIDLVIADLNLDNFAVTGAFLCAAAKKKRPDLLFIISSRMSGVSFLGQAMSAGADGMLTMSYMNEIENILPKWLNLAVERRDFDVMLRANN